MRSSRLSRCFSSVMTSGLGDFMEPEPVENHADEITLSSVHPCTELNGESAVHPGHGESCRRHHVNAIDQQRWHAVDDPDLHLPDLARHEASVAAWINPAPYPTIRVPAME